jgi:NTE family protein/lysophospholipid hydrolase
MLRLAEGVARRGIELIGGQHAWTTYTRGPASQNLALVLPTGDDDFASAASELARAALSRYRRVAHVTAAVVDAALGEGAASLDPSDPRGEDVLALLQRLEPSHEIVLYECEARPGPWTERCLRQADRVVVLVRADRPEQHASLRALLDRVLQRRHGPHVNLCLIHGEQTEVPRGAAAWTANAHASVHHVRMGVPEDYERLARTLVRTGVAVVLSGGGARGIAHIGVLKALEDAHIPVDSIAGTSMGSIFAAGYARGWKADELLARVRALFRRRTALYDPVLPFESLLAGKRLEQVLRTYFEGLDIEDLWVPFFCVSTDLTVADRRVHDRGPLWPAVAASCSIPGIFPPRREGDHLLVDGGVVDNLPTDVMATRFQGTVIASDVHVQGDIGATAHEEESGGRLVDFARWLNPLRRHGGSSPAIFDILIRSSLVGSQRATIESLARGEASLYLPLPVHGFRMLDWTAHDDLFAVGYEFGRRRLATWRPPWEETEVRV